ncbi:PBP1A family penicillin-binding protein [Vaginisenegalia massiliensis]|uniref:PBP1A family penicillin-binding protein n=1 Tax=Vaginisenegalia massiliensis TaxID=2058294 RepID=UPI000F51C5E8|nr:PBP1A family penicillin-binding protein [Vaginisenegalia massiliensis]
MVTGSRIERKKYQTSQPTKPRKRGTGSKEFIKRILFGLVTFAFLLILGGALLFGYYAMKAPELAPEDLRGQISSKIYDREGNLIKELGSQNRDLMTVEEIPDNLKMAVIAIEDARFYQHHGIDPIRIAGALVANLKAGGVAQGGSTITQQLIKLSVFSTDFKDQTIERKAQEAWLALRLEQTYTKDEILTMYLNKLFYSNNTYGAKTATKLFFGKNLDQLTIGEAALLAGIPQAPTEYDPYNFPDKAKQRRDLVLKVMYDRKMISQEDYQKYTSQTIESMLTPIKKSTLNENDLVIDSYLDMVAREVKEKMNINIFTDGVEVYTNLNMPAQQHIYNLVNNDSTIPFPNDQMQTAISIIDVNNGEVQAVIGGRKQDVMFGHNRATASNRSVGSTMKPLADYGPAFEYLNYSTGTMVEDEEYKYSSGLPIRNYDYQFKGKMTIREALVGSRNIPALKTLQKVGLDNAYAFLQKLDINITNDGKKQLVEANAIGGEISPVKLSAAYGAISNGGKYHAPFTVKKVITSAGTVKEFESPASQAMKDSTAYMLLDILKGVPGEFAPEANIENLHHAGKSGTTNYTDEQMAKFGLSDQDYVAPDSWFVGITPQYSVATWVGYDNPFKDKNYLSLEETKISQLLYADSMKFMMKDLPDTDWVRPSSVSEVEIEKYTDPIMLPGPYTPSNMRSKELFVKGKEPSGQSTSYGRVLNMPTGFDANYNEKTKSIDAVWGSASDSGQFELSINGTVVYTGRNTSFSFPVSEDGQYVLKLRMIDGNSSSDYLVVNLDISTESTTSSSESESSNNSNQSESGSNQGQPENSTESPSGN